MTPHARGLAITLSGAIVLSFDALLVRLAACPIATVVLWRGALAALAGLFWLTLLRNRRPIGSLFRAGGYAGLLSAMLLASSSSLFVLSVMNTAVANTVVILAATPFFAAVLSWGIFRERVRARTWLASLFVLVGLAAMLSGSVRGGGLKGDLAAALAALSFAANTTLLRRYPAVPRLPVIVVCGLLMTLVALPFADPFQLSARTMATLAVLGLLVWPTAMVLMFVGTRYLPAAEVALFLLVETALSPFLVWWFLGETVTFETAFGAALIGGALLTHSLLGLREACIRGSIP